MDPWYNTMIHDILKKDLWKGLRELFIILYKETSFSLNIIKYR